MRKCFENIPTQTNIPEVGGTNEKRGVFILFSGTESEIKAEARYTSLPWNIFGDGGASSTWNVSTMQSRKKSRLRLYSTLRPGGKDINEDIQVNAL